MWARGIGSALTLAILQIHGQGVIHIAPNPQPYYSVGYPGTLDENIDIVGDGTTDFVLESGASDVDYVALITQNSNQVVVQNGFVAAMNSGDIIGPSLGLTNQWYEGRLTITILADLIGQAPAGNGLESNFANRRSGYIGFDLIDNGTNYYGWMLASCPSSGGLAGAAGLFAYITDWAFETSPNTPIQAGQISEPASFTANLTGANEIPPNHSANSGIGAFTLERFVDGSILTYHVELDGSFSPTDAGIFGPPIRQGRSPVLIADLGMAQIVFPTPPSIGPVTFAPATANQYPSTIILPPPTHIVYDGQIALSSNEVTELKKGEFYVNLKSSEFRQGELRGEILSTAPIQFSATLSSHDEICRNHNTQQGTAAFTLSGANLTGNVALDTNVSWNSMGIYDASIALPQTLVAPLTNFFGVGIPPGSPPEQVLYPEQVTLTDRQISQLKSGQLFLQILTSHCRDELGGRITQGFLGSPGNQPNQPQRGCGQFRPFR